MISRLFRTSEDGQGVRGFATKISEVKEETEFQKRLPEGWVNLLQECLLKGLPIKNLIGLWFGEPIASTFVAKAVTTESS